MRNILFVYDIPAHTRAWTFKSVSCTLATTKSRQKYTSNLIYIRTLNKKIDKKCEGTWDGGREVELGSGNNEVSWQSRREGITLPSWCNKTSESHGHCHTKRVATRAKGSARGGSTRRPPSPHHLNTSHFPVFVLNYSRESQQLAFLSNYLDCCVLCGYDSFEYYR